MYSRIGTGMVRRACILAMRAALAAATVAFTATAYPQMREAAAAQDNQVKIDNFTFTPNRLVVPPGATVTWTNEDDIPHTVVSTTRLFRSKALDTDDRFSFTFTTPGVYEYFCSLHPHMKATIVVEAEKSK
jgi:plastocyanin